MPLDLVLHLNDPKELFVFDPATYDPFDADALGQAGVDYLLTQSRGRWGGIPELRATVYVPHKAYAPDLERQMRIALVAYCEGQLADSRREHAEFVVTNAYFLAIALVVAAVGFWLRLRVGATGQAHSAAKEAIGAGIDLLTWVVLWAPVSAFVLEWLPFYRTRRCYEALRRMELIVRAEHRAQRSALSLATDGDRVR